jgi:HEAT repeat protein
MCYAYLSMNDSDWSALVRDLRNVDDVDVAVAAAERLHRTATPDDLPRLRALLLDDSFFVREAAAWPLSELAGATALAELFQAYQRGFDEGHDNDGFTAALIELAAADPEGVRQVLEALAKSGNEAMRENAAWLMEFCENERDA